MTRELKPDLDSGSSEARLPRQSVRTALSIFLFAHLFTLAVSMLGRSPAASELARALAGAKILAAYRQLFALDQAYSYPLTRAGTTDVDFVLEATLTRPDGATESRVFPDPPDASGERTRHWRSLARNMAQFIGDSDLEAIMPRGFGAGLLDHYGAKEVDLRLRGHLLQDRAGFIRGDDPGRTALWRDDYQARVWRSGDQVRLMKKEARGETAPVAESNNIELKALPTPSEAQPNAVLSLPAGGVPSLPPTP
jgi:hypothetical protein